MIDGKGLYVGSTESMLQGCEIAPSSNDYIKSKKKIDANSMSQIIMAPEIQYFINILFNVVCKIHSLELTSLSCNAM